MKTRNEIEKIIKKAVKNEFNVKLDNLKVEKPEQRCFGDYATNIAMLLSKELQKDPKYIAELIAKNVRDLDIFEKVEVINPGFINFFLSKKYLQEKVREILKGKTCFFVDKKERKKINVEFISANPTGPLTIGNGRGGFSGDVLSRVLEKVGHKVKREYFINDAGEQVRRLGESVLGLPEAPYKGKYIEELRAKIKSKDPKKAGEQASRIILEKMIKPTVKRMKIKFDVWFSEKQLEKEIEKTLKTLKEKGFIYEKEGAVWFKSTEFGDDKDRVLIKSNGEKTYFASDIAYLKNKFNRGFNKLIFFLGADHYGYLKRMESAAQALGYKKEQVSFIIMQLVRLIENGQEVKMSKRQGNYITLDELIEEVGLDVARFFFLTKSSDRHLVFDFSLAKERSKKNPVFYIQYAYARIANVLKKAGKFKKPKSLLLNLPSEINLMKQLIYFPEIIEDISKDYHIQRLPKYCMDLASAFHHFYDDCRIISDNKELSESRLSLVLAVKITLRQALSLMGISSPSKM